MATFMTNAVEENKVREWVVIHPLDDVPETKLDMAALGAMPMTRTVRLSLLTLRVYLLAMLALVAYRVVALAGWFGAHAR